VPESVLEILWAASYSSLRSILLVGLDRQPEPDTELLATRPVAGSPGKLNRVCGNQDRQSGQAGTGPPPGRGALPVVGGGSSR
jgi:hypothetical protein